MDITTEARALSDNHPRLKNKALLLSIAIVNPCAHSNLGNAVRHVGKHLADAVERKKNKYRGSFPATYSLLPLAMSTCGEVGSDVHALIKELVIRQVEHRSETHSNESQHLAEGKEVARLRRRFSFVVHQALSFRTRHHLCRQGVALASTRQLRLQGPVSVDAHRTEGVTESEGREGANGVRGGIGVGGGNGDGNGVGGGNADMNGDGDGDGTGTGTATGVEVNEGAKYGNGDGGGDPGAITKWKRGRERGRKREQFQRRTETRMGTGTETRAGLGGAEERSKKRKKPHKNCRRVHALLFRTRHHLGRQEVAFAGTRQLRSQGLVLVHTHRTEGTNGSERPEGSNGVGSGIGVGGGNGGGNGVGSGDVDGAGTGTGRGVEANEGAQNGNWDGSGDGARTTLVRMSLSTVKTVR